MVIGRRWANADAVARQPHDTPSLQQLAQPLRGWELKHVRHAGLLDVKSERAAGRHWCASARMCTADGVRAGFAPLWHKPRALVTEPHARRRSCGGRARRERCRSRMRGRAESLDAAWLVVDPDVD